MKRITILLISLLLITGFINSQNIITGFVSDESGEALPGVLVQAKGTKISTLTKADGTYSININSYVNTLIFSFIGMKTTEKEITGNILNVIMIPESDDLDEVVVTSISEDASGETRKGILDSKKSGKLKRGEDRYVPMSVYHTEESVACDYEKSDYISSDGNVDKDIRSGLLTAGELNDYGKWELWQDISDNQLKSYKTIWQMKPQERYCVQITNYSDRPVVNATVYLKTKKGDTIWTASTDNTGKAELWMNMYDSAYSSKDLFIDVRNENQSFKLNKPEKFHDGINFINIPAQCNIPDFADIAFVVDATGSMGDEIAYLKAELEDVLQKIKKQHKDITVNTASVFYRDKTDAYLVRKSDFTHDIKTTINFIREQAAGGGGDFPEAVDAGLNTAINELSWTEDALAKVIFLILDAPPHGDSESVKKIQELTKKAAEKGIRIIPVTASGIDKSTEYLMRSMALATNGTYVFLTDDSGIGNAHIEPTTDEYQVEFLNDVFIRLIKQYLTAPKCEENITYDEEEIQDTSFITDNSMKNDTTMLGDPDHTEIDPNEALGKVKYYPNPTVDILNIEVSGEMEEMFLADVSG
ncbi:MAG: carboxypeptidase-like regulatory domain-containing protein, partial [Bacteroidales bacterium]|nr:carboxypeptidase-like regulatory domain-containing protein [Bacteroidales bacterium]